MATKKSTEKGENKAEFVRKFPDASAQEVVEHAKKAGIEIPVQYVYNVRAADRLAKKKDKAKKGAAKKPVAAKATAAPKHAATKKKARAAKATAAAVMPVAPVAPARSPSGAKDRFIAAMLEIGVDRASSILDAIRNA